MEGTCTDVHISFIDSKKGSYSAEGIDIESGARSLAVAWHTLLVGLEVGIEICEAPKDAASLVEVDWKLFGFTVTGTDCEERGDNGIESNLKVQRSCCRVVVNALQVVAMREVQTEVTLRSTLSVSSQALLRSLKSKLRSRGRVGSWSSNFLA